jgi:hypothetical protein
LTRGHDENTRNVIAELSCTSPFDGSAFANRHFRRNWHPLAGRVSFPRAGLRAVLAPLAMSD